MTFTEPYAALSELEHTWYRFRTTRSLFHDPQVVQSSGRCTGSRASGGLMTTTHPALARLHQQVGKRLPGGCSRDGSVSRRSYSTGDRVNMLRAPAGSTADVGGGTNPIASATRTALTRSRTPSFR